MDPDESSLPPMKDNESVPEGWKVRPPVKGNETINGLISPHNDLNIDKFYQEKTEIHRLEPRQTLRTLI